MAPAHRVVLALCCCLAAVAAVSATPTPTTHHYQTTAAAVQADPRAAYAEWAAHWQRPATPADYSAWKANVLPRAAAAPSSAAPFLINGLASLPLDALKAGLSRPHPAREAAAEDAAWATATWAAFPYAAEVAAASTVEAGASPGLLGGAAALGTKQEKPRPRPLPPSIDWAAAGMVGPVKNQHVNNTPCGCCWSFASTGVMETALLIAAGADAGCDGGDFEGGIAYAIKTGGLTTEASYPYRGKDGRCHRKKARAAKVGGIAGFRHVPPRSEAALAAALAHHPVAVAVCCSDAFIADWHAYTGGLMTFTNGSAVGPHPTLAQLGGCAKPLDHAVVVVGAGVEPGAGPGGADQPFWLVKNSWGEAWGERGFFKLAAGLPGPVNKGKGAAGLLTMPGFPTVHKGQRGGGKVTAVSASSPVEEEEAGARGVAAVEVA